MIHYAQTQDRPSEVQGGYEGGTMKRTYETPTVVNSGDVRVETKGVGTPPPDAPGIVEATGSVGFYL